MCIIASWWMATCQDGPYICYLSPKDIDSIVIVEKGWDVVSDIHYSQGGINLYGKSQPAENNRQVSPSTGALSAKETSSSTSSHPVAQQNTVHWTAMPCRHTGTLLTAACRNLEPGDKMEVCEPIPKT